MPWDVRGSLVQAIVKIVAAKTDNMVMLMTVTMVTPSFFSETRFLLEAGSLHKS